MAQARTRTLFAIDVFIALAFIGAGASAIAFLVPYSTIDFATSSATPTFLGLTYGTWHDLHLYSGLAMLVGGAVHFVLHWGWMARVAKGFVPGSARSARRASMSSASPVLAEEANDAG